MNNMTAIVATRYGIPAVLQYREVAKPAPKDNEILIKIHAATVNAGDGRMRSFSVPPLLWLPARITLGFSKPKQPNFGMELAGEVQAIGKNVTEFKLGDQVFASTLTHNFGAHAEYKCLPEDGAVVIKPKNVRYEDATTLPIGANTALHFLSAVRPVIDRCYPLAQVAEAHRYVDGGHKRGSVVITVVHDDGE